MCRTDISQPYIKNLVNVGELLFLNLLIQVHYLMEILNKTLNCVLCHTQITNKPYNINHYVFIRSRTKHLFVLNPK